VKDKLMVTRDVVFDEKKPWNWEGNEGRANGGEAAPNMFTVQCLDADTIHRPATEPVAAEMSDDADAVDAGPESPAVSIPSVGVTWPRHHILQNLFKEHR
jgi:hypothetical protein